MIKKVVAAAVLAVALVGCAPPNYGTVVDRKHEDAYSYVGMCTGVNPSNGQPVQVVCTQYQPESWTIKIATSDGKKPMWWSVPEVTWVSCEVGSAWRSVDDHRRGVCG